MKFNLKFLAASTALLIAASGGGNALAQQKAQKKGEFANKEEAQAMVCLLYTSPSPRDRQKSRMPSSA